MGKVAAVRKMLNSELFLNWSNCDQSFLTEYFLQNYNVERLRIDTEQVLAVNMYGINWNRLTAQNGAITLQTPNNTALRVPCFFHFNGTSYWDISKLINSGAASHRIPDPCPDDFLQFLVDAKSLTQRWSCIVLPLGKGHTYE